MPKYVLDDNGIATIVADHDGGICTVNDIVKKFTIFLLCISLVLSIIVYGFFYYETPNTGIATNYSVQQVERFKGYEVLIDSIEPNNAFYGVRTVVQELDSKPKYYSNTFEKMVNRGVSLYYDTINKIDNFKKKWR